MFNSNVNIGLTYIQPCKTGYFVIFSSKDAVYAADFQTRDEYEAVSQAFEICGEDWTGIVSVEDNSKWEEDGEPILEFEMQ